LGNSKSAAEVWLNCTTLSVEAGTAIMNVAVMEQEIQ